ncbi:N-acetylmuramoyl-L-alanine amidase family protein [Sporosarcina cascadiensis]|uniref:N-acetylmuramoyl-L-alanine amidase family protein n=1 Tax=Sporosarcina cascadiensis TaxID=2660747 RepID=UPI0018910E34|nr:N-acetylmuramoyl-L-alanine amidase [Sporosarcina cascadiensis]
MTLIVLDAGHGPETPGKRSPDGKLREFQFNLAVAEMVGVRLTREGLNVRYVHENSRDVPLSERTAAANRMKADAYVSIHANAHTSGWSEAQGIETYIYPAASKSSAILANLVQQSLIAACKRLDRGVKKANFAVLRDTQMPAILAECGFMSHKTEAVLLQNKVYLLQCARALAFGILNWAYQK